MPSLASGDVLMLPNAVSILDMEAFLLQGGWLWPCMGLCQQQLLPLTSFSRNQALRIIGWHFRALTYPTQFPALSQAAQVPALSQAAQDPVSSAALVYSHRCIRCTRRKVLHEIAQARLRTGQAPNGPACA